MPCSMWIGAARAALHEAHPSALSLVLIQASYNIPSQVNIQHPWVLADLAGQAGAEHPPLRHHDDAAADVHDEIHVMLYDGNGKIELFSQPHNEIREL